MTHKYTHPKIYAIIRFFAMHSHKTYNQIEHICNWQGHSPHHEMSETGR